MRKVKMVLFSLGILIGIIVLYFSIITFLPVIKVPQQPLQRAGHTVAKTDTGQSALRQDVSFDVKGTTVSAWLYLPENLSSQVACVSAQCPGLDGRAAGEMALKRLGMGYILKMVVHGQRDFFRSWFGLSPHKIPLVGKPGSIAGMNSQDAYDFVRKYAPSDFVNEICARIILRGDKYRPVKHAKDVRCPVLLQICEHDRLIPITAAEETAKELGKLAQVINYPIGHFDIYTGENFEKAVSDQLEFFKKHL